jgi:hypothetical protein
VRSATLGNPISAGQQALEVLDRPAREHQLGAIARRVEVAELRVRFLPIRRGIHVHTAGHEHARVVVPDVFRILPHRIRHHRHARRQQIDQLHGAFGAIDQRIVEGKDRRARSGEPFRQMIGLDPARVLDLSAQPDSVRLLQQPLFLTEKPLPHHQQLRLGHLRDHAAQHLDHALDFEFKKPRVEQNPESRSQNFFF